VTESVGKENGMWGLGTACMHMGSHFVSGVPT
jgi:hypothetical protein